MRRGFNSVDGVDPLEFGRYLTQQRELRGMSRADVVNATKIPESVITALESGHIERLPARVFVVYYIRAYAGVIGMEPDEAVLRYDEIASLSSPLASEPEPPALPIKSKPPAAKAVPLLLTLLVVVAAVVIYSLLV